MPYLSESELMKWTDDMSLLQARALEAEAKIRQKQSEIDSMCVYARDLECELRKQIRTSRVVFDQSLCARVMGQTNISSIARIVT